MLLFSCLPMLRLLLLTARNLGVIFDSFLTMSDHISSVSKSCFMAIRDLRRIRNTLDSATAKTIATSLIHSKVDYCNSLFDLNLPRCQLDRLKLILNSAARAVSKTPRFTHISPVLKSLHWLKIDQRIHYDILSITYETFQSRKPSYLHDVCKFNATLALVLLPLSLLNAPQFPLNSKNY